MLGDGSVSSMSEVARKEGMTQIMNLLKLQAEIQKFLLKLDDPKEIRKFSERKLRNKQNMKFNLKHNKNEL
jgi:hypothetical protein